MGSSQTRIHCDKTACVRLGTMQSEYLQGILKML